MCGGQDGLKFTADLGMGRGVAQKTGVQEEQRLWGEGGEGSLGHQDE